MCNGVEGRNIPIKHGDSAPFREWGGMECGGGVQWCAGTKNPENKWAIEPPFREWKGLLVSLKRVAWRMPLRPFGRRGTADAPAPFRAQGHHQTGLTRAESPEASKEPITHP